MVGGGDVVGRHDGAEVHVCDGPVFPYALAGLGGGDELESSQVASQGSNFSQSSLCSIPASADIDIFLFFEFFIRRRA